MEFFNCFVLLRCQLLEELNQIVVHKNNWLFIQIYFDKWLCSTRLHRYFIYSLLSTPISQPFSPLLLIFASLWLISTISQSITVRIHPFHQLSSEYVSPSTNFTNLLILNQSCRDHIIIQQPVFDFDLYDNKMLCKFVCNCQIIWIFKMQNVLGYLFLFVIILLKNE